MPMYNLIEYRDNYSKTSGVLWKYCRCDFKTFNFFKIKEIITGQRGDDDTKNVEIMVPLKYLSNFWRNLEILLINCETNLDLNWSEKCVIVASNLDQEATFSITDTKRYVPFVTLSTQDNAKVLERLKSGFERTIN